MALINVLLSGSWRLSGASGQSAARGFSALTPLTAGAGAYSVWIQQDVILPTTMSELRISYSQLSSPQLIFLAANNLVRINFAGMTSSISAASSGVQQFKEAFLMMGTSGLLPSGFSIGNSGTDSATVTILIAG